MTRELPALNDVLVGARVIGIQEETGEAGRYIVLELNNGYHVHILAPALLVNPVN